MGIVAGLDCLVGFLREVQMTVIAYDGKIVAADGIAANNDRILSYKQEKIWIVGDTIVGASGELSDALAFLEWNREKLEHREAIWPDLSECFQGIVIDSHTRVCKAYCNKRNIPLLVYSPYAIGSGEVAALAAMVCGKNAEEAVKIAIGIVPGLGGIVHTITLDEVGELAVEARERRRATAAIRPPVKTTGAFPNVWRTNPPNVSNDRADAESGPGQTP